MRQCRTCSSAARNSQTPAESRQCRTHAALPHQVKRDFSLRQSSTKSQAHASTGHGPPSLGSGPQPEGDRAEACGAFGLRRHRAKPRPRPRGLCLGLGPRPGPKPRAHASGLGLGPSLGHMPRAEAMGLGPCPPQASQGPRGPSPGLQPLNPCV